MRVLLLVMDEQRIILDNLYEMIRLNCSACDIVRLSKAEQLRLSEVFGRLDLQMYDRVVIFSRLKRLQVQVDVLRCIRGLVFLEHDACQNYMSPCKYRGAYSAFYKRLPSSRALVSGHGVARRLREEGVDAIYISKGYDAHAIWDMRLHRDIELAFVGSVKGAAYEARAEMLHAIGAATNLLITRTESGRDYVELLNRIRIFVSADVGMGEYMIKNFEAMACGCVLLAWSQGEEEDAALGFEDGHNVMLYRSLDEALDKIELLKADPVLAERIAFEGKAFVEQHYTFARIGRDLARAIEFPIHSWTELTFWQRLWVRLRYRMKV